MGHIVTYGSTVLAGLAAALLLGGLLAVLAGEHLVAGVSFLSASFAIYLRETRG